jgi:ATP-dependent Clp endopeptidase proteolytic subunit ClpP
MWIRILAFVCLAHVGQAHNRQKEWSNVQKTDARTFSMMLLGMNPANTFNPLGIRGSPTISAPHAISRNGVPTMTFKRVSDGSEYEWDPATGSLEPKAQMMMPKNDDPEVEPPERKPSKRPPGINIPMVGAGDDKVDVMSRLLRDRIILLGQQVDDEIANLLVAQMLYLAKEDPEADINFYINSPGGSVSAGLAIFDTMQYVPCDINTICFGTAASMGAFLLGAGTKGKRRSLPNSRIMIHQPLGGAQGQAADIEIQAKEILYIRELLCQYISDYTGQTIEKIRADCDRDYFMTAEQAKDYGIVDEVLPSKIRVPKVERPDLL